MLCSDLHESVLQVLPLRNYPFYISVWGTANRCYRRTARELSGWDNKQSSSDSQKLSTKPFTIVNPSLIWLDEDTSPTKKIRWCWDTPNPNHHLWGCKTLMSLWFLPRLTATSNHEGFVKKCFPCRLITNENHIPIVRWFWSFGCSSTPRP